MTLLRETKRLVLPPSSNLPQRNDNSWLFLLPVAERAVWYGDPGPDRLAHLTGFFTHFSTVDDPADVGDGNPIDVVIIGPEASAETVNASHQEASTAIVQLAGSVRVRQLRSWITPSIMRRRPTVVGRAHKLWRLVLARATHTIGKPLPEAARSHASDVNFTRIPEALTTTSDPNRVSIGLAEAGLPTYIMSMATAAGHHPSVRDWAFGPPRGFESQKVVFLMDKVEGVFQTVVKITQHERFNDRLAAEGKALKRLADFGAGESLSTPRHLFESTYKGRAVLAQSALSGAAMRSVARPDPASATASAAFRGLIELGELETSRIEPGQRLQAFTDLAETFSTIYRPPNAVRERIDETVRRLGGADFPSVMMHGDPGMWNFLVVRDGRPGLLDWENADSRGVPLWDLFIFARTFGVFLADARGIRYTHRTFTKQLLEASALKEVLFHQIREYRRRVDIPAEIVDDLFVMCWAQQAVRQAAGLASPAWGESTGTRFLGEALKTPLGFHD